MSEIMNQYELLEPFQNKDAGFSRWTYAKRKNKDYFLKEFLDPVYPTDNSISLEIRKQRIDECRKYQEKKKKLYEAINNASDGNIVRTFEFFRADNHYYISTERIYDSNVTIKQISTYPLEDRLLLCKTIAHSIMLLHRKHIVHSDIKENNILIKRTETRKLVGKIIDFDASFFEYDPPKYEDELGGDQVYYSPEACKFICEEPVKLTCKMDVFALGLLFHQYLTGDMPKYDTSEYDYAFEAVLDEQELGISNKISKKLQVMIKGMLECEPDKRLSMEDVYSCLMDLNSDKVTKKEGIIEPKPKKTEEPKPREISNRVEGEMGKWFFNPDDL